MLTRRLMTISCAMVMAVGLVNAQEFPSQPIRIVIPYAPGGGSDILARPVAVDMSQRLKQPVIIDNKGGADGNIGAQFVARSAPDGYNLMMANNSHVINQFIYKNPGFEMGDLASVSLVGTSPIIWWGLLAPAKTDPAVLDKLNAAVTAAVRDPKISERWTAQGMIPTTTTRTEFQTLVKNELQKWEKVVRENGITVD